VVCRNAVDHFGISFAAELSGLPTGAGAGIELAGADCTGTLSITLPPTVAVRDEARYVSVKLVAKNVAAKTPVVRERKFADPDEPNRLPEAPPPNAAPMSAPLPC